VNVADDYLPKLLVRRLTLVWAVWLITMVVFWFMGEDTINAAQATVVTAIIGILATVIAFYQHQRGRE